MGVKINTMENEVLPQKIAWQAHEYEHVEKSGDWYWIIGVVAIALALISLILENILFAVLIVVGAAVLMVHRAKHPRLLNFEINNRGVVTEKTLYPYKTLDSFCISDDEPGRERLVVKSQKLFTPFIVIPVGETSSEMVRNYLLNFLEEEEHEESFAVQIMEWLGF